MKKIGFFFLAFLLIVLFFTYQHESRAQLATPSPTPEISPTASPGVLSNNDFSSQSQATPTPTPTPVRTNPFDYTPLPAIHGPEYDISEVQALTANRSAAQVDDSIIFSVTLQDTASYSKDLQSVCFESTDGNFGCQWGIQLAPGESVTLQNVGTWVHGGVKDVWVEWTQDGINFYQPMHATHVQVNILG